MSMNRRRFNAFILAAASAAALPIAARELVEGRDWRPVPTPQPSDTPGQIEILEFFSYGCPHCGRFNEVVLPWAESLPPDVVLRRIPVTFGRKAWENLARLYFSLEYTDNLERLDQAAFDALHEQRKQLFTEEAIFDWIEEQGVDRESFATVFKSFGVETRLMRSKQLTRDYEINSVPTMTVAGRYIVVGEGASTYDDLLVITEGLLDKARRDGGLA